LALSLVAADPKPAAKTKKRRTEKPERRCDARRQCFAIYEYIYYFILSRLTCNNNRRAQLLTDSPLLSARDCSHANKSASTETWSDCLRPVTGRPTAFFSVVFMPIYINHFYVLSINYFYSVISVTYNYFIYFYFFYIFMFDNEW